MYTIRSLPIQSNMYVYLYLLIWIAVTGLLVGYKEVPSGVYVDDDA